MTVAFWPRVLDQLGEAEVEDLGAAVGGDEDVLRLQVAVDDALLVRGRQALRDLARQVGGRPRRERPALRAARSVSPSSSSDTT